MLASLIAGRRLAALSGARHRTRSWPSAEFALVGACRRRCGGPRDRSATTTATTRCATTTRSSASTSSARRRDAIYPATVVGKPRQEDFFIGDLLQELLSPLFPLVMPGGRATSGPTARPATTRSPPRSSSERYRREAMASRLPHPRRGAALADEVPARHRPAGGPAGLPRHARARPRAHEPRDGPLRLLEPLDGHARLHRARGQRGLEGRVARPRRPGARAAAASSARRRRRRRT